MTTKFTTDQLSEVLAKESKRFAERGGSLKGTYAKFEKLGIDTKSTYSFPLKDTIGRTFQEQLKFSSSELNSETKTSYMQ